MQPKIIMLEEKKLVGQHLSMSVSDNKTGKLWTAFAPKIKSIQNRVSQNKISLQLYPSEYFQEFNPDSAFVKWAAVEVENFNSVPDTLETMILDAGMYAVFQHKGSSQDRSIFQYIFSEWLPSSKYKLDNRPHFELLGPDYRINDPNAEEEIWIPVKI